MSVNLETLRIGKGKWVCNISRLGMGCWALGGHGWGKVSREDLLNSVQAALDCGVNFFDTADVYGLGVSEQLLCQALGNKRHDVIIATKGGVRCENGKTWYDCSPSYLREAVNSSLRRLRLDIIPLYYIHWPDGITPIHIMMEEMLSLQNSGKIGAIGLSNFTLKQLKEAISVAPVDAVQVQWNMLYPEKGYAVLPLCSENNIALVAWGALADGLLTGKFTEQTRFDSDDHRSRTPHFQGEEFLWNLQRIDLLKEFAQEKKKPVCQVALRWILDKTPSSCALFGAKSPAQVRLNAGAMDWALSADEIEYIDGIVKKAHFTHEVHCEL